MKYDLSKCHVGPCQNCKMRGILYRKPFMRVDTMLTNETIPTLALCISCFETPAGVVSENLRHERLPAEEYK